LGLFWRPMFPLSFLVDFVLIGTAKGVPSCLFFRKPPPRWTHYHPNPSLAFLAGLFCCRGVHFPHLYGCSLYPFRTMRPAFWLFLCFPTAAPFCPRPEVGFTLPLSVFSCKSLGHVVFPLGALSRPPPSWNPSSSGPLSNIIPRLCRKASRPPAPRVSQKPRCLGSCIFPPNPPSAPRTLIFFSALVIACRPFIFFPGLAPSY